MKRILLAGNIIVDYIKVIEAYPEKLSLTTITAMHKALGGLVPNVGIDLAKLDEILPVLLMGYVGEDPDGDYVMQQLDAYKNLDIAHIKRSGTTSFSDVMLEKTGERTFFTYRGADNLLSYDDFKNFDFSSFGWMHIGYVLLSDGLDRTHKEYGTELAKILFCAQKEGVRTSIDVVSEEGDRFVKKVVPALAYTDYCTINEHEAQQVTGIPLRAAEGHLLEHNMLQALQKLRGFGVQQWITIHAPEGAYGLDEKDKYTNLPSLALEQEQIKDSVGAGDAFLAGLLYGAYRGAGHKTAIQLAREVAALSLSEYGASQGIRPVTTLPVMLPER